MPASIRIARLGIKEARPGAYLWRLRFTAHPRWQSSFDTLLFYRIRNTWDRRCLPCDNSFDRMRNEIIVLLVTILILVLMGPESTESISNLFSQVIEAISFWQQARMRCASSLFFGTMISRWLYIGEYLLKRYAVSSCKSDITDGLRSTGSLSVIGAGACCSRVRIEFLLITSG